MSIILISDEMSELKEELRKQKKFTKAVEKKTGKRNQGARNVIKSLEDDIMEIKKKNSKRGNWKRPKGRR